MKWLDYVLQYLRIAKARPYVPRHARLLDIGCADGAVSRYVKGLREYVGIDDHLEGARTRGAATLIHGIFPRDLDDPEPFDAITLLAVLEHVPHDEIDDFAASCARCLRPGGVLLATVPDARTDAILDWLKRLRLLDGMDLDEHHGFDARLTGPVFTRAGLRLVRHLPFQLGLNNLYVFQKPG